MRLFVVEPLGRGGMVHYVYQLCTALAASGAEVTLVTARDYELGHLPHNFTVETQLDLWPLFDPASSTPPLGRPGRAARRAVRFARRGWRAVRLLRAWWGLTRRLRAARPDVVQFGKINFPFEAYFLRQLQRDGVILTQICHEFELREQAVSAYTRLANRLYAAVYDCFAAIFFHADENRRRFHQLFDVPTTRTYLIPHGNEGLFTAAASEPDAATARRRYGLSGDMPVILFFGNITPSKGLPDLIEAFAQLRRTRRATLLIAGYPSKYVGATAVRDWVADVRGDVVLDLRYIPVEEVATIMAAADVVVFPYRNSTQSGALQVAYAFGRPVVATRVGGLPDAVEEGRSGWLAPPGDPAVLADILAEALSDPERLAAMGAYARHLSATRFAWEPIAAEILTVYATLPGVKSIRPVKQTGQTE